MEAVFSIGVLVMFIGLCACQTPTPGHTTHPHGHVTQPVASGLGCPEKGNWTAFGASCYYFRTETYNWFDAKAVCRAIDSKLVEVETAEEEAFLVGMINQTYHAHQGVWIAMQDFQEEGQWVWSSSLLPVSLTFWNHGEPEDRGGEEDCAAIANGGWFDTNCEDAHIVFICETEAVEV